MFFKGRNFLILGVSLSGAAAAELLLSRGARVYLFDDAQRADIGRYSDLGAVDVSGLSAKNALKDIYCIVVSPGVSPRHRILEYARHKGISSIGELELGCRLYRGTVAAITGTNGKSTVTSLLHHIMRAAEEKSYLCGNIGIPISCYADAEFDSVCCCEVSSFQLEYTDEFKPHISAVLNVGRDHINRHKSLQKYIDAKKRIFANQKMTEFTVLNFDCPHCRTFFEDAHSNVYWFSLNQKVRGAYLDKTAIMFEDTYITDIDKLLIPGVHNISNSLAAVCMACVYGVPADTIGTALGTFCGINHRLSYCGSAGCVDFYNDSKATNPQSTQAAIRSMQRPTVIILGGSDKNIYYGTLIRQIVQSGIIKKAVCYGDAGIKIYRRAQQTRGAELFTYVRDFEEAVLTAYAMTKHGDTLLLSPACASFDQFTNFEQRGEKFCALAQRIKSENDSIP